VRKIIQFINETKKMVKCSSKGEQPEAYIIGSCQADPKHTATASIVERFSLLARETLLASVPYIIFVRDRRTDSSSIAARLWLRGRQSAVSSLVVLSLALQKPIRADHKSFEPSLRLIVVCKLIDFEFRAVTRRRSRSLGDSPVTTHVQLSQANKTTELGFNVGVVGLFLFELLTKYLCARAMATKVKHKVNDERAESVSWALD
jgi:hypothetical protein